MSNYNYDTFPLDMDEPLFEAFSDVVGAGDRAPDGTLTDARTGETVTLKQVWKQGPLVLEFGSRT